ncbi:hypothetical protein D3C84_1286280 [compost metagenome]
MCNGSDYGPQDGDQEAVHQIVVIEYDVVAVERERLGEPVDRPQHGVLWRVE